MKKLTSLDFSTAGSITPISEDDANYFRKFLDRTLKVSGEPEWNLKEGKTGQCKGDSLYCPCANTKKVDDKFCYQVCLAGDTCDDKKKNECAGVFCVDFKSPCLECKDYRKDCAPCIFKWDPKADPRGVREILQKELQPTQDYGNFGKHFIMSVKKDGSLDGSGGVEIPTIGRRVDYYEFLDMFKLLYGKVAEYGGYVNERSGLHYHMLVDYNRYGCSIERPIPGIFLRNLHQLFRMFQNCLVWMSSAGESWEHFTRWEKFRESIIGISGVKNNALAIQNITNKACNVKYSLISYRHCQIDQITDNISNFHIEARFCDGLNSPTAVSAFAVLLYAFAMKAIDLSLHGVIQQPADFFKEQVELSKRMLNNRGDWETKNRWSNTKGLQEHTKFLTEYSIQMISLVRPYLKAWPEAANVLISLAERPCTLRLMEGATWEAIENELSVIGSKQYKISSDEISVLKAIDLLVVTECKEDEWVDKVSEELGKNAALVKKAVDQLKSMGKIEWSPVEGTFSRV